MSRSRYRVFENEFPYFFTCTVVGWLPAFTRIDCAQILFDSWRFLQAQHRLTLYGYVVLENHIHGIATSPDLAKELGNFKSFTARRIVDLLRERNETGFLAQLAREKADHKWDRDYQFWQEGSHPQQIVDAAMMEQKLDYMHNNPLARGYVEKAEHWRYSSARNYAGLSSPVEVVTDWRM